MDSMPSSWRVTINQKNNIVICNLFDNKKKYRRKCINKKRAVSNELFQPWSVLFQCRVSRVFLLTQSSNFGYNYVWNHRYCVGTPLISEILCVKNMRAIVVCGFSIKSLKKHILKFWKKSWVPFGRYLLNSTANPAHFHSNWAESAVLSSR